MLVNLQVFVHLSCVAASDANYQPKQDMTITNPTDARRRLYDFAKAKKWNIDNCLDCVSEATEESGAYRMSLAFEDEKYSLEFLVGTNGVVTETGETA